MRGGDQRLLSAPHRVRWAGFVATTAQLQQMGWQISVEQDFVDLHIRLALRHEDFQLIAITHSVDFHRWADRQLMYKQMPHLYERDDGLLTFNVARMSPIGSKVHHWQEDPYAAFQPIDAKPQLDHRMRVDSIEDLIVFAPAMVETKELIVDESEVSSILARLAEAQKPEQARIRDRQRLRESREGLELGAEPRRKFHAQILSIAA